MRIQSWCSLLAASTFAGVLACGELSFPVVPAEEFSATLLGSNEVPTPVTTTASGSAVFGVINDSILSYRVEVVGMDSVILSHIHAGDGTVAGPVIVNILLASTVNCKQNADTALDILSSSVGNPTTITAAGPHRLTVGSTPFMRIASHTGSTPSLNNEYTATVTGASTFTVPVNVTIAGTGGKAQRFALINTTSPRCRAGYTGAIAQTQIRPANLTVGAIQGYGATPRERFDSLISLMRSGNVYVNVHTKANPSGEVRGQLSPR
jgi:hypothetical protein